MKYAEQTQVPVDSSKSEIERLVQKYGATEFAHGWRSERAMVQDARSIRALCPAIARAWRFY
jgi:hypothetical protein